MSQRETNNEVTDINMITLLMKLNINWPHSPVKRQRLWEEVAKVSRTSNYSCLMLKAQEEIIKGETLYSL